MDVQLANKVAEILSSHGYTPTGTFPPDNDCIAFKPPNGCPVWAISDNMTAEQLADKILSIKVASH